MALSTGSTLASGYSAGREAKKFQKHQKKFRKIQRDERLAAIGRRREAVLERHAKITVPGLVQSMAGRGFAMSTIAVQALEAAGRARDRALADLASQQRLELKSYDLFRREQKYNRKMAYISGVSVAAQGAGSYVGREGGGQEWASY